MRLTFLFVMLMFNFNLYSQESINDGLYLTISPIIDQSVEANKNIISALTKFLTTKNDNYTQNQYWLKSDFNKYIYPYIDIFNIENSKHGANFYQPTLMEIISTDNDSQKIIKLAFLGHNKNTKENHIKSIYNIICNVDYEAIVFSRYIDYAIAKWPVHNSDSITYHISPNKSINRGEMLKQQKDIEKICSFFQCTQIPITYFSCISPKEIFEIKGFDYNPMMYIDKSGGLADFGNIIYSGNNSEYYQHEIVHIYTNKLFPKIDKFIDEGIATYIGGSGQYDYKWHRAKLAKFLDQPPNFNFAEHTDPYERLYFEEETAIPYISAALICEYTFRKYGKEKLIELLGNEDELWAKLGLIGLNKLNINTELRNEIKLELTSLF